MIKSLLTTDWLSLFSSFTKLIVGFSGGLDSTVLLHVLASQPLLRSKLLAVHVNHGISVHASTWQTHCEQWSQRLQVDFITQAVEFERSANIEEAARIARYKVFTSLLKKNDCLLLGHHQEDQVETVLLHLFRGAGIDGLAAMNELGKLGLGSLARPFLNHPRAQLEDYAASHQLAWIEDESNQDLHYTRNYLRHQIIPELIKKWPGVKGVIARTAVHCQHAKNNLEALAISDCPELMQPKNSLAIDVLLPLNVERIINVLRVWLKKNHVRLPSAIIFDCLVHEMIFARQDAVPEISWGEFVIRRYQQRLYLDKVNTSNLPVSIKWSTFPAPLILKELGITLCAKEATQGLMIPQNAKIMVRFRQGGELIYLHGQSKQLKKLFQEWNVPPWLRDKIPLIYINEVLGAVVGHVVSDHYFNTKAPCWSVLTQSLFQNQ